MLSIHLDSETEGYLAEIIAKEHTTSEEILKKLVHDYWQTLKPAQTLAQRRGGHPQNVLQDAPSDLSLRENRKKAVADHIQSGHQKHYL